MSSYRYSADANNDIEEISLYLLDLNPIAANKFLDSLEDICLLLGQGLRSFPVGNYLLFYRPAPDGIDVARVIYGGRDLPEAFGG